METPDMTWERVLLVWWSFFWRFTLFSLIAGAALGLIGGLIVGMLGRPDLGRSVGTALGWLVSIPVSIWAIRKSLAKSYPGFAVTFQKTDR